LRHLRNRRATDNSHQGQFIWTLFVAIAVAAFAFQQYVMQKPVYSNLQADNAISPQRMPASLSGSTSTEE
jgi:hypothetical protein